MTRMLGIAIAAFLMAPLQIAQDRGASQFAGTWKGVCGDGKDFVILTLARNGANLGGTLSLANMRGAEGQCAAVQDPPSPEHAMQISDVRSRGEALAFKGSRGAEFEMTLVGAEKARLKFMGTAVEEKPWELKRVR